jgi:DNA repair ATPase RecN
MLPRLEAELEDAEDKLARLNRFHRDFGGRATRILEQEKRIERKARQVERAREALEARS